MKISLIVAMSQNGVIGVANRLPWHLPADLQHFKKLTIGKPILMGRKTFESIGRPLPGRDNIVLSRELAWKQEGCKVVHSIAEALQYASSSQTQELMVIGGGQLYQALLPFADCLYVTRVLITIEGDTYFPALDSEEWQVVSEERFNGDTKNPHSYCFVTMHRNKPS